MHEMEIVALSLGITDDPAFSQMLYSCCNPQSILMRNKQYNSKSCSVGIDLHLVTKDKQAQRLPIESLVSPLKQL